MRVEKFVHRGVSSSGDVRGGGAVRPSGAILMSTGEGCGLKGCHCSDGCWITIALPRTPKGTVEGIAVRFDSKREMNKFFKKHRLEG